MILNGIGRGCTAVLLRINEESYSCDLRISQGRHAGRVLEGVEYEDISRRYNEDD